ncbi:MAG: glycoside hydrolase family 44 protein [Spirochaetia bacterium]|nr:glycoside hydrolase family 44 protein [Spirochaetia bacterium]
MKRTLLFLILVFAACVTHAASITINTSNQRAAISPLIYGTNQQMEGDENLTCMRLGGNRMTGYNWENNASNAGSDWLHSSDDYMCTAIEYPLSTTECVSSASGVVDHFVDYCNSRNYTSIVTIPMAGYVAADKNGTVTVGETAPSARWRVLVDKKGSAFQYPPNLSDNYVYNDEEVWHLVQKYGGASTAAGVKIYQLDNEGDLWDSTHPRIHPTPVGAAEWVNRGVSLSKAIKDVDSTAQVFGPVFFGVWSMVKVGADWNSVKGPCTWYVEYYLKQMKSASDTDGRRLLDAIDLHYYSEAREGLYPPFNYSSGQCRITEEGCTSTAAAAARMQAPRSLWDTTYTENSSVGEWATDALPVIPKVQAAIGAYYPGTKIAVTEHGFGGGNDYSGGIAVADTLGIFGKYGVYVATMWKTGYGPFHSAAYKLYRNYNGSNGTYGDTNVQCDTSDVTNITCYASIEGADDSRLHLIVLNKASTAQTADVTITGPQSYTLSEAWAFGGTAYTITARSAPVLSGNTFSYSVPAYSAFHFILHSEATPTITATGTLTRTPIGTPTYTPYLSATATPTHTPQFSLTMTPTFTVTRPVTILNTCDSLDYNGTWSGANAARSINTSVTAAITEGSGSLKVDITTAAGWNDSIASCTGFMPEDWSSAVTLTLDVHVDPANIPWQTGSTWHELVLYANSASAVGGAKWYRMLAEGQTLAPGMNHVTFTIDRTVDTGAHTMDPDSSQLLATDPVTDYFFVLNSDGDYVKTGTIYLDNIVLHTALPSPTQTVTPAATSTRTATSQTRTFTHTMTFTPTMTATQSVTYTRTQTPGETSYQSPTATITGTPPAGTVTPTTTPTYTRTGTTTDTRTSTATPSFTATRTVYLTVSVTASGTFTMTPATTATQTSTLTPYVSQTPTLTPTLTVSQATLPVIEPGIYPNPSVAGVNVRLVFDRTAASDTTVMYLYTAGFRLIRRIELGATGQGRNNIVLDRGYFNGLSNGTYFYFVEFKTATATVRSKTAIMVRLK